MKYSEMAMNEKTAAIGCADESDHPWASVGGGDHGAALARAIGRLDELELLFGAPRDLDLAASFLRERLPGGRWLVYGAGTHTSVILEALERFPRIQVAGVVDRLGERLGQFCGYDVISPEDLGDVAYDGILLSHGSYEDEMRERLAAAGVPAERVAGIYADPAFHRLAAPTIARRIEGFAGRRFDVLLVRTSPLSVISGAALASVLPPERTLQVYMGRGGSEEAEGFFETVNLDESLTALAALIRQTRPRAVLIQCVIYKNYLSYWLKARFPEVAVIHEPYDMAVWWRDHDLQALFGLTPRTIARLRLSERAASQTCDLVVSKRGGPLWDRLVGDCAAPHRLFFPMACEPVAAPGDAGPGDGLAGGLVYAGFLPVPAFLDGFKNGYDFLDVMERVCRATGMTAELYNSSHLGPGADRMYASYLERYRDGPVVYRRRLPYAALIERMGAFAFGWLCDVVREFQADRHGGVCNRWTGYVSAGLPPLLDAEWRLMADLTTQYGAGVVVERTDSAAIATAVAKADLPALRAGCRRLRRHLLDHNDRILADVARAARVD